MEWCRMYTLKAVMCVVFLCCGLQCVVPDSESDIESIKAQKLKELWRSLDAYKEDAQSSPTQLQVSHTTNTSPSPMSLPTVSSLSKRQDATVSSLFTHQSARSRVEGEVHNENFLPNSPQIESYQDFYRTFYGTPEGVNLLRKQYGPTGLQKARAKYGVNKDLDDVRLANEHFIKIRKGAKCQKPVPQVIRVKDYYPDPSREYLPRCTVLYRCGDDTGCCDSDAFHCGPSAIQEVTLHFYTLTVNKNGMDYTGRNSVQKLLFENHTACQCQLINDLPRMQDGRDSTDSTDTATKSRCGECPVPFTSRVYKDGRCGCDCFDRQKPCIRIKRGREPLPEIERRCVEANHCHIPDCEYGLYDAGTGFCPRRHDEDQRTPHRRPYGSANQRWAFLERD